MKILRMLGALLVVTGMLVGCRANGNATADYRERPFRAEVRWEREGGYGCADLETAIENGLLVLSHVRLLAPPSLEGIVLSRKDGKTVLERDGMSVSSAGADGFWSCAALICAEGRMRYVCDTDWEGLSFEYAEIVAGERVIEILREPNTGIPKRMSEGDVSLTVIRFEPIEARG